MTGYNLQILNRYAPLFAGETYQAYTERQLDQIPALRRLPESVRFEMRVIASILPFRVNQYVIDELIDWDAVPCDPIFQLTFPQRGMLCDAMYERMADLLASGADPRAVRALANELRRDLNPHPAGQQTLNVPRFGGEPLRGMQHKYRETLLYFPSHGQTCHAYCTFCFRWAQFVGDKDLKFAAADHTDLHRYLKAHREVSDVLITGGDPMVMRTKHLKSCLEPLLGKGFDHVQTIRIGTKALSYWPYRFVSDGDADELLALFERVVGAGKHLAVMAHINHWRELEPPIAAEAVRRIRSTGAVIRSQAPVLAHINDDPGVWARNWKTQVRLGIQPYYMFVERDTGARDYFQVPLHHTWQIYRQAVKRVSGLGRTARGPSMSTAPGKIEIQGVTEICGQPVFSLRFLQARNPDWVQRPFFAEFDPKATWLDDLKPAFGEPAFFFDEEFGRMTAA